MTEEVDVEVDAATGGKTPLTTARPSRDRHARVPPIYGRRCRLLLCGATTWSPMPNSDYSRNAGPRTVVTSSHSVHVDSSD